MKKSLLFIMNNLNCGGAEKSLISLLEMIDYSVYRVDLYLLKHEGTFLKMLPKEVNLLPEPVNYKFFDMPLRRALIELLLRGSVKIAVYRLILGFLFRSNGNGALVEQKMWKYLSLALESIKTEYDVAIGFQEKNPIYFCVDKVKAKKKIGWIHTDYTKLGINPQKDIRYLSKLTYLVTVSNELVNQLKGIFPNISENVLCINNIISPKTIKKLSFENVKFKVNDKCTTIISVGRLAKEKGLDISLDAIDHLIKKGYDIKWYLVGEGNVKSQLEQKINERKLQDKIKFLGLKENPYPYIRLADIYLQTSRYEGKSLSIEEAKVLAKPIIITNFETANDHIENNVNGIITGMDYVSVATSIEKLIIENGLKKKFHENLKGNNFGSEKEIDKFYELINV